MADFTMTPQDIAALRVLLARAKAAGWQHAVYQASGDLEHAWNTNAGQHGDRVKLYRGRLAVLPRGRAHWSVPVESIAQVAAVLELAGALPTVGHEKIDMVPVGYCNCAPGDHGFPHRPWCNSQRQAGRSPR
jgi:hypothetical protein